MACGPEAKAQSPKPIARPRIVASRTDLQRRGRRVYRLLPWDAADATELTPPPQQFDRTPPSHSLDDDVNAVGGRGIGVHQLEPLERGGGSRAPPPFACVGIGSCLGLRGVSCQSLPPQSLDRPIQPAPVPAIVELPHCRRRAVADRSTYATHATQHPILTLLPDTDTDTHTGASRSGFDAPGLAAAGCCSRRAAAAVASLGLDWLERQRQQ